MITVLDRPYTKDDVLGTLGATGPWWGQLTGGRDPLAVAAVTPHAEAIASALGRLIEPNDAGPAAAAGTAAGTAAARLDGLGQRARASVQSRPWDTATRQDSSTSLTVILGALAMAGAQLRAAGAMPARTVGRVDALHLGSGGVPKLAADAVAIDAGGVVGDRQGTRRHHGRPWQALCLWSSEVIELLQAEGHPIEPGFAGENVTIGGLDWAEVRSGVRLRLGAQALVEVSVFALPCASNASWFRGREFARMHHDRGPVSRVYASVLEGGSLQRGDEVVLEP